MYPEFIAIYVMLIIIMGLLGAVIYFLFKLMKNGGMGNVGNSYIPTQQTTEQYYDQQYQGQYQQYQEQYQQSGGVVFCKQCATQFDASQLYCPNCGTRR